MKNKWAQETFAPPAFRPLSPVISQRRPIDSQTPVCSPATLAGLTIYPPASRAGVFSYNYAPPRRGCCARAGDVQKQNARWDKPIGHFVLATSYSRTTYRRTTIGAAAFHFRVRNGNGWFHRATITRGTRNFRMAIFEFRFLQSPIASA